jgi:hypothetical protein
MSVSSSLVWNLKVHIPKMAFPYRTTEGWKITKTCVALVIASKKKKKKGGGSRKTLPNINGKYMKSTVENGGKDGDCGR